MRNFITQYNARNIQNSYISSDKENTIVVIKNMPEYLIDKSILYRYEYLGQYGHIINIEIRNPKECVFVKYSNKQEASYAVLSLNNYKISEKKLMVYFYTTNAITII